MAAAIEIVPNRLSWRVGKGISRSTAIASASAKVEALSEQLFSEIDRKIARLDDLVQDGDLRRRNVVNDIYDCANSIGSIAGVVGLKALTSVAYSLCNLSDFDRELESSAVLGIHIHLACMIAVRNRPSLDVSSALSALERMVNWRSGGLSNVAQSNIFQFVYCSVPNADLGPFTSVVDEIECAAKSKNAASSVTGALIANETWFLQCLEGPAPQLSGIISSLLFDARHGDLKVIEIGTIADRKFPQWSMTAAKLGGSEPDLQMAIRPGFSPHSLDSAHALALIEAVSRLRKQP